MQLLLKAPKGVYIYTHRAAEPRTHMIPNNGLYGKYEPFDRSPKPIL